MNNIRSGTYHHGDLKAALVEAAIELIVERGGDDFSMVEAARLAGVSSAAPYRHFKDRSELLDAVAVHAFDQLSQDTAERVGNFALGSRERVIAHGLAYNAYVIGHPAFFDIMWGKQPIPEMDAAGSEVNLRGFHSLVESIGAWCTEVGVDSDQSLELAVKLWAIVHGLTALSMNNKIEKFLEDVDIEDMLVNSIRVFLDGVAQG